MTGRRYGGAIASGVVLFGACGGAAVQAPSPARAGPDGGFYTQAQADRGAEEFRVTCSECHSIRDFRGRNFEWDWRRQTAWDLFRRMRETMPDDFAGLLSDQSYADIFAYILRANDYASGNVDLVPDEPALDAIPLGPGVPKRKPQGGYP